MVDEDLLDDAGRLCLDRARLIAYSHGEYRALGRQLGTFGYTVKKRPLRRRCEKPRRLPRKRGRQTINRRAPSRLSRVRAGRGAKRDCE